MKKIFIFIGLILFLAPVVFGEDYCYEGETKEYTCPDGTNVPWCGCENKQFVCVISPENQCEDYCYEGDLKKYTCPSGEEVSWCGCENNRFVCIISPETKCAGDYDTSCETDDDCSEEKTCSDGTTYHEIGCNNNVCEQILFAGGTPCSFGGVVIVKKCSRNSDCSSGGKCIEGVCIVDCPQYSPPGPDFCKDGKIVGGRIDENGCQRTPKCIANKNKLKINAGECPNNCTCTGSVTKCEINGGREMIIIAGKSGNTIVQIKNQNMSTKVELYKEDGKVYGVFKNNKTREIKIMPDQVRTRLTERIGNLEEHEIELDQDGTYQIQTRKRAKLFGLIPVKEKVKMQMNSETGEITRTRTSWWGFLAKDELIIGNRCATVSPDSRGECCQNKGFDTYNQENGECE